MAKKKQRTERTPTGHEVPVPKRGEFFANLKKVAKAAPKGSGGDAARGTGKK
jgi:hypothetical protein